MNKMMDDGWGEDEARARDGMLEWLDMLREQFEAGPPTIRFTLIARNPANDDDENALDPDDGVIVLTDEPDLEALFEHIQHLPEAAPMHKAQRGKGRKLQ